MKYKIGGWLKHLDISRFLQWRINSYLMWILPFQVMQAYVAFLGRIYYFFNQRYYLKIASLTLRDNSFSQEILHKILMKHS